MPQPHALLSRAPHRDRPQLALPGGIALAQARAHEVCGPARRSFAAWAAGRMQGPVFWIAPAFGTDPLNPDGLWPLADPGRFTFLSPKRAADVLWCLEEVLRAGVVPLAVADLTGLPGLTAVRRLHLAAEMGMAEGAVAPLALLLTPGDGGAPGIETRWHMAPAHAPGAQRWQLDRRRARTEPPRAWVLERDASGRIAPAEAARALAEV